jgi:type I restriction enzyme R subunit
LKITSTCRAESSIVNLEKEVESLPLSALNPDAEKIDKLKEIFTAHYGKGFIEKEILYYNFIEREVRKAGDTKELKNEPGILISPRPKQKFGTDKIMSKIDDFLAHEHEDDYFEKLLEKQLAGVGEAKKKELLEKRRAYSNNKNVYSLLLQYAAGFGKSNIIGWTALQLKDLRRPCRK